VLDERIRRTSGASRLASAHLSSLCSSWQLLADVSFSDLLLYVPVRGSESFEVCAQVRPFTSQTLYLRDVVGERFTQPEQPAVERAFREGKVWRQEDPVLVDGVQIRMDAVPVRFNGDVVGVVTKEGTPAISRRPGRLEEVYLSAAEHLSTMISEGSFPPPELPGAEWPRVGDGLLLLDAGGRIEWASPNGLSCLRRLGATENVVGCRLEDLVLGDSPVSEALTMRRAADGELDRAEAHVRLRVVPLVRGGETIAGLCLVRDVSELRARERLISVKDAAIREVHHRVKNNLQTIASLLRLQGRRLDSKEAKAALEESVLRIGSIALVHETLSEERTGAVEFADVARRIAGMVSEGLLLPDNRIAIDVRGRAGELPSSLATPLAVTLTELLQNALEHGFPDGRAGKVVVELRREDGGPTMTVRDDGVGIAPGNVEGRLGLHIVRSLVAELGGRLELDSDRGTRARVWLPLAPV